MTGILSRDLFCCDTLAIGGAISAAVMLLGLAALAVRATGARRDCVSQMMRHRIKRLRRTFSFWTGGYFFSSINEVPMPPATMLCA